MKVPRPLLCAMVLGAAAVFGSACPTTAYADDSPPVPSVRVHISSTRAGVQLEQRASGDGPWTLACEVPCDRELPLSDEYRVVTGADVAPGAPFRLRPATQGNTVTLRVDPPSRSGTTGGVALIVLGVALAAASVAGVIVFGRRGSMSLAEVCGSDPTGDCEAAHTLDPVFAVLSAVSALGSVAIVVAGGFVVSSAATTSLPTLVGKPAFVVPLGFSF